MRLEDQGVDPGRYAVIPRTLTFLTHGDDVLLLRGAPTKRLWAGRLNGVGGHLEPGEDVLGSARREVREETGLEPGELSLRAVVHVRGADDLPGVILFVFVGRAPSRQVRPSREGHPEWHPRDALPRGELVEDLYEMLPRVLADGAGRRVVYAHYAPGEGGTLEFRFTD